MRHPKTVLRPLTALILAATLGLAASAPARGGADPSSDPGVLALDAEAIVARRPNSLALYRTPLNARVLILDFPDFAAQASAMMRIGLLVEDQRAPRDRVLDHGEARRLLADRGDFDTIYIGHDYRAADLARFFTLAPAAGLSPEEKQVLRVLIRQRVLRPTRDGFQPIEPAQAVISLAVPSAGNPRGEAQRALVLRHERAHGEYFTHAFYRARCHRFWRDVLTEEQRAFLLSRLGEGGYDTGNEDLIVNEMQAYLGFTDGADLGLSSFTDLRQRFFETVIAAPPL